ncbi:tetratricopeptide repeat protein [Streptomyces sp. NBC_01803]|uniref:tetratricopeptide repeat protein n=1 Tax=Streptomyces sp. NBC_01803 TaxID=2975946 RepID=UPI002DDA4D4D|nr:tetratricopeptide repeat protein [Streptomyces sp. NBC_01803]WSA43706.1 tetratricopeptide repeat protein [Streptomyces sp. NBC_01803]
MTGTTPGGEAAVGGLVRAGSITGDVHPHAPRTPVLRVPRQLDVQPVAWADRDSALADLERVRAARHGAGARGVVMLHGPAGSGKSALAARWLGQIADTYPDGQLTTDLSYATAPGDVLGAWLRALGEPVPGSTAGRMADWRSVTATRRLAIVVEGTVDAGRVRPLLPTGTGCLTVVTGRDPLPALDAAGAAFYRVGPLDETAARDLLTHGLDPDRVHPRALRRLADRCGGWPLAVPLARGHLATADPPDPDALLATLTAASRKTATMPLSTTLDSAYRALPPAEQHTYRAIGSLPVPLVDGCDLAALLALPVRTAYQHLVALRKRDLLTDTPFGMYRMPDAVREHAAARVVDEDDALSHSERLRRLWDWYLFAATAIEKALTPSHAAHDLPRDYAFLPAAADDEPLPFTLTEPAALAWLTPRQPALAAAIRTAADAGWDEMVWQLVVALWPMWHRLRNYETAIEMHELALEAVRRCRHARGEMIVHSTLAWAMRNAGRHDQAHGAYAQVHRLAEAAGDRHFTAQALHGRGNVLFDAGHYDQAAAPLRQALRIRGEIGYHRGVALTHLLLGRVATALADWHDAIIHLTAAREGLLTAGDAYDAARAQAFLGRARAAAGQPATGDQELCLALAEFHALDHHPWQGHCLEMRADIAAARGHTDAALGLLRQALAFHAGSTTDTTRVEQRITALARATP